MKFSFSLLALASLGMQRLFSQGGTMAANELVIAGNDPGMGGARTGLIYAANEGDVEAAWRSGNVIEAANDGNLSASPMGLSQPLTQYATGVADTQNLQAILDSLFPSVPAGGINFSYMVETEAEEFQKRSLPNITRPVHGQFPELKITGSEANGRCKNVGLVSYIDRDQGGLVPAVQQREVQRLRNIILRSLIADGLAKLDGAAVADTSKNWNDADADPDSDVDDMIDAGGKASGVDNNVVVFGRGAFMKRRRAYRKAARTNGGEHAVLTPDQLRDIYQVDDVINLRALYRSSATANTPLIADTVYTYDARPGLSFSDSSNIKRFDYVNEQGGIRVWIEVGTHRVKFTVDAYTTIEITRAVGIRKRPVTFT